VGQVVLVLNKNGSLFKKNMAAKVTEGKFHKEKHEPEKNIFHLLSLK
jgi:hypothetical protein